MTGPLIPGDVYRELVDKSDDWSDKEAAASLLEGTLKEVKARIVIEYRAKGKGVGESEYYAEASEEYREARESAIEARRVANRAKGIYRATESLFEARRTVEANERAAMRAAT